MQTPTQTYVMIDGNRHGPYSPDEVRQYLSSGHLDLQMPAWREGMTDWQPLETIMSKGTALPRRLLTIAGVIIALALVPNSFQDDLRTLDKWNFWRIVFCEVLAGITVLVAGQSRWRWLILLLLLPALFIPSFNLAGPGCAVASLVLLAGIIALLEVKSRWRWLLLFLIVPCAYYWYYEITEAVGALLHPIRHSLH